MRSRALLLVAAIGLFAGSHQAQTPQFRSTADVVVIEAQVAGRDGLPVAGLSSKDFEVRINGHRRNLVSADFIRASQATSRIGGAGTPSTTAPNLEPPTKGGRVFVIALDEGSFKPAAMQRAKLDIRNFVGRLDPADRVGVYRYPCTKPSLELTRDRAEVNRVIDKAMGCFEPPPGAYYIGPSEVIDMSAGDSDVIARVARRECGGNSSESRARPDPECRRQVAAQANAHAMYLEQQAAREVFGLTDLFRGLAAMPERKTVVLVSAGLPSGIRVGARVNLAPLMSTVFKDAAAANANVYVLHLDDSFFDATSSRNAAAKMLSQGADGDALARGLEQIAGESHGSFIRVRGVAPDYAFEQILRETTAYYLLGVATLPEDRDGRVHFIQVKSNVKRAEVQHRLQVVIPKLVP